MLRGTTGPVTLISTLPLVALLAGTASGAFAQDAPAARGDDAIVEEVVVVTASRREEKLLNAPATMTVLTESVINAASGQSLTDLLRLVPGLNVVQTSARDVNINARAATGTLSDAMLVLLDGRSVYQDLFGFVQWDLLPIDITEIKQVEVIRGPASAVWGANAMTGVLNVITKTPRELQGTNVNVRFGQFDRTPVGGTFDGGSLVSIGATHAHAATDRLAYKVSLGWSGEEANLRPTGTVPGRTAVYPVYSNRGTSQPRLDGRVDYDLGGANHGIVVAGGFAGTEGIIHTGLGPLDIQRGTTLAYGRLTYTRRKLKLQGFVNALGGDAPAVLQRGLDGNPLPFVFGNQTFDVEFSNLNVWRSRHLLSYGGNYRHNQFDLSFARGHSTRDEGGLYAQDEIFLSDRYRWILGGRVDRFDVLGKAVLSPRTTFLFKPTSRQTMRFSFNRAFRAPSLVNSYLDVTFVNEIDLGSQGRFRFPTVASGNAALREEQLTAFEVGYIGGFGRLTLGAAAYLNQTDNMIQFAQAATYTGNHPPAGWPLPPSVLDQLLATGRGLPSRFTYMNFDSVTDRGIELSSDLQLDAAATAFLNYSWQAAATPHGFDAAELNRAPAHRLNGGLALSHGRSFGHASASVVSGAYWQDVLPGYEGQTDAYAIVEGGVGVRSSDDRMSVSVRVSDPTNHRIQEHIFGDVTRRSITGEVRLRF